MALKPDEIDRIEWQWSDPSPRRTHLVGRCSCTDCVRTERDFARLLAIVKAVAK